MTRLEENRMINAEMNKRAENMPIGTYEEIVSFQLGAIATMLADISKSLAILADKAESDEEAEEYEEWHSMNGVMKMPKGLFDKIYNEAKEDNDDI